MAAEEAERQRIQREKEAAEEAARIAEELKRLQEEQVSYISDPLTKFSMIA